MNYDGFGHLRNLEGDDSLTWLRWEPGWTVNGIYGGTKDSWTIDGDPFVRQIHEPGGMGSDLAFLWGPDGTMGEDLIIGFYEEDHLGSVRGIRDEYTGSSDATEYTPYGSLYSNTCSTPMFGFTGHLDLSGNSALYYAPYRIYIPDTARWITRDPMGMRDGPNVYAYVGSNPVSEEDPDGRSILPNADRRP